MVEYKKLIEVCKGKHIYIQTHNFPDPDAIASAYGLKELLAVYDIESTLCYAGRIDALSTRRMTDIFNIDIEAYDSIKDRMTEHDYIVCVDSQKNGGNIVDMIGREIATIDHHPTYAEAEYLYKDVRIVGSCSTLIADYYKNLGVTPSENVATALLYGLKMDTAQFNRGVTQMDIDAFAYLFPVANPDILKQLETNTMEYNDLKAYGAAIENIRIYDKVGFAYIPISCQDALIAIISDFILQLDEVDVCVVFSKRKDGIKFSIRSEIASVDAGKLAYEALKDDGNGGGHATMAGGIIRDTDEIDLNKYTEDKIIEKFLSVIDSIVK